MPSGRKGQEFMAKKRIGQGRDMNADNSILYFNTKPDLMKIILYLSLPVILSCNKLRKQPGITPQVDTTTLVSTRKQPDRSKYYTTKDTVIIPIETGDTDTYSKAEFNHIVDTHPEFFSNEVRHPDLAYYGADKEGFNSEAGQDGYYVLYAWFLKQRNSINKYAERRKKLISIYENINELFEQVQHGGTYFGHQSWRIIGYAEYAVSIYKHNERNISETYDISEEKELYIKSLRLLAAHNKERNKIVNNISQAITDIFYLQRAQEFQYSNYEYY